MTVWNAEALLGPLPGDQPCGEDLEYGTVLGSLDAFRLFGQSTPPEQAPAWADVRRQTLTALATTRDVRLLTHLAAALLRTDGLPAFADTLCVAAHWLETYWPYAYPLAVDDVMLRRNALNAFADPMAIVDGLRRLPLASGRHGTVTLRDLDIAAGIVTPGEKDQRLDQAQITSAFAELPPEELSARHAAAQRGVAALDRIEAAALAGGGLDAVPDLSRLRAALVRIEKQLRPHLARSNGDAAEKTAETDAPAAGAASPAHIQSREDAIRALDAVAAYFRRHEPSSPVPLFVERAKRLVAKDFLEVLADVAPEALGQARAAGGIAQVE